MGLRGSWGCLSFFFERGFWGYRVSRLGFGVQTLGVSGDLRASKIRNARFLAGLRFQV